MTTLTLAVRNLLAQDVALKALLGRSQSWDTWIFSEEPMGVRIENTQKCLIVITENSNYDSPNEHNTMEFPRLLVDIWADPTRNADRSVKISDARTKVQPILRLVNKHLHTVHPSAPNGMPYIWGTAAEISAKTGVIIGGSRFLSGPEFSPVRDSEGSWMGRATYGVNVIGENQPA